MEAASSWAADGTDVIKYTPAGLPIALAPCTFATVTTNATCNSTPYAGIQSLSIDSTGTHLVPELYIGYCQPGDRRCNPRMAAAVAWSFLQAVVNGTSASQGSSASRCCPFPLGCRFALSEGRAATILEAMRFLIALLAVAGIVVSSLALRIHMQGPLGRPAVRP